MATRAAPPDERRAPCRDDLRIVEGRRDLRADLAGPVLLHQEGRQIPKLIVAQPVLRHQRVRLRPVRVLQEVEQPAAPDLVADLKVPGPLDLADAHDRPRRGATLS